MKASYPLSIKSLLKPGFIKAFSAYKRFIISIFLLIIVAVQAYSQSNIVYVTPTGAGNHSGDSWGNAAMLWEACSDYLACPNGSGVCRNAIAYCGTGTVWMAQGTYTFNPYNAGLGAYCTIYGGFEGNETDLSQRNPALFVTKIINFSGGNDSLSSGTYPMGIIDIGGGTGCAYYVKMDGIYLDNDVIVLDDGVRFNPVNCTFNNCLFGTALGAQGITATDCFFQNGSGSLNEGPNNNILDTFTNCTFKNISSSSQGVINVLAVSCTNCTFDSIIGTGEAAAPVACQWGSFANCTFSNCSGLVCGAIDISGAGPSSVIQGCTFTNNRGIGDTSGGNINSSGGAIAANGSTLSVFACSFTGNHAGGNGGAISHSADGASLIVENCLFVNNSADTSGGAIYDYGYGSEYLMNTFVNNTAPGSASAVDNAGEGTIVTNNIFQGNGPSRAYNDGQIQGFYSGIKDSCNFSTDTSFGTAVALQLTSNYQLSGCSPVINRGNNNFTDGQTTDLLGNPRVQGIVDPGCYEFQGDPAQPALTASATLVCPGNSVLLQVSSPDQFIHSPGSYYLWSGNNLNDTATTGRTILVSPTASGIYVVAEYNSGYGCFAYSNSDTITVSAALVAPQLNIATPAYGSTICQGTPVKITATAGSGGEGGCSDSYRYSLDAGNTFNAYVVGTNINTTTAVGMIWIESQRGGCANCTPTGWNLIAIWNVTPAVTPIVTISTTPVIQQGQSATFNASVTNGGSLPSYSWTRNGVHVGTNSSSYTDNSPVDQELVKCTLTSNSTSCLTTTTAVDSITISVESLIINDPAQCYGTNITVQSSVIPASLSWNFVYPQYGGLIQPTDSVYYPSWNANATTVAGGHGQGSALNQFYLQEGICFDHSGNLYVADEGNARVLKFAPGATNGVVVAGGNGGGSASNQLSAPMDVKVDASGNLYIMDQGNFRVQEWKVGVDTGITVAGGHGAGSAVNQITQGYSIVLNAQGYIFVSDRANNRVVEWFPGTANQPIVVAGGHGSGSAANQLNQPIGIWLNGSDIYIADAFNNRVQKWTVGGTSGATVAGGNGAGSGQNQLNDPWGVYMDGAGDLFIADAGNYRIQMIPGGTTTAATIAGGNGAGAAANQFAFPAAVIANDSGSVFVSDQAFNQGAPYVRIQKFAAVFAHDTFVPPYAGLEYQAQMVTFSGTVLTSNTLNIANPATPSVSITSTAALICPGGYITFTPSASATGSAPVYRWYVNNVLKATLQAPGVWSSNTLNVNDQVHCEMTSNLSCVTSTLAVSNTITMLPYSSVVYTEASPNAAICSGTPVNFSANLVSNIYQNPTYKWYRNNIPVALGATYAASDFNNGDAVYCVATSFSVCNGAAHLDTGQMITMSVPSENVTAAGSCTGSTLTANLPVIPASLKWFRNDTLVSTTLPNWNQNATTMAASGQVTDALTVDGAGFLYVCDRTNARIIQYPTDGSGNGHIVAGGNGQGTNNNQLFNPADVAVDSAGNIYVAENNYVSKWGPGNPNKTTVITSGTGSVNKVKLDDLGNIYVLSNNLVEKYAPGSNNPVAVAAGSNVQSFCIGPNDTIYVLDYNGVYKWVQAAPNGVLIASVSFALDVNADAAGNVYTAEVGSREIRRWPADGSGVSVILGGYPQGLGPNQFQPNAFCVDARGNVFVSDQTADRIQKFTTTGIVDTFTAAESGSYIAAATSFAGCTINSAPQTISPYVSPAITISSNFGDTICAGTAVTFNASALNGGPAPVYQWLKNGQAVGSNNALYTESNLSQGDLITCLLTSNAQCLTTDTATSNTIGIDVRNKEVAAIAHNALVYLDANGQAAISQWIIDSTSYEVCGSLQSVLYQAPVGSICASANEGDTLQLTAPAGMVFTMVNFASYGAPTGTCGNFAQGACHAPNSMQVVSQAILGNNTASINVLNTTFGGDPCFGTHKYIYVQASYSPQTPFTEATCSNLGKVGLVMVVTGTGGQKASDTATLTVVDTIHAIANAQHIFKAINASGTASVSVGDVDSTYYNCTAPNHVIYGPTAGHVCGSGNENDVVTLSAPAGMIFTHIDFASFGNPGGACGNFTLGSCNAVNSDSVASQALLGHNSGTIQVSNTVFGDPCFGTAKHFYVQASYAPATPASSVIFTCSNIGDNNLLLQVVKNNDTSFAQVVVTVADTTKPSITCPGNLSRLAGAGLCYSSNQQLGTPVVTDNCSVVSVTNNKPSRFYAGTTPVTWTVTDASGNTGSCVQNITVTPNITRVTGAQTCAGTPYNFYGTMLTQSGTYRDTLLSPDGCDTVVTLVLTVSPVYSSSISASICSGAVYMFNGVALNTSGTYADTLTSIAGCDSVITLTLTVLPHLTSSFTESICAGQAFTFNGVAYTVSGSYSATYSAVSGCDSVVTLNLNVLPTYASSISAAICAGGSYSFNGMQYSASGNYADTLTAANGCDSIVTLNLVVNPGFSSSLSVSICAGESYSFNGVNHNASGTYTETFTAINGCDSTVTLNLSVLPIYSASINAQICNGESYLFNGVYYSSTGTYVDTLTAVNGCDSIVTLNLNVLPAYASSISAQICGGESYSFNGVQHSTTGTYVDTLTAASGCDSVVTLNLNVLPTYSTSASAAICAGGSYSFNGLQYSASGNYVDTLTAVNGCDSIVTLNLTVKPSYSSSFSMSICSGNTYTFNGVAHNNSGTYTATFTAVNGCDSVVALNLIVLPAYSSSFSDTICAGEGYAFNGQSYSTSGTYSGTFTTSNGCDSIVTLKLVVLQGTSCPANVIVNADAGNCTAVTEVPAPLTPAGCSLPNLLNSFNNSANASGTYQVGATTVQWTITNTDGSVLGCTQTVTVIDSQKPRITAPANLSVNTDSGHCYATGVALGTPVTSDNCGVASVTNNAPSQFSVGTTTVTWTVTDIHGNINTATQTVTVSDNQAPVISCPAGIAITASQTSCNKTLTIPALNATDNCGIASIKNSFNNSSNASGTYPVGTTQVVWTATDIHNLSSTCMQTITIYPCMQLSASIANTICTGTAYGSIMLAVTGGQGSYTYHWSNGQSIASLSGLAAGNYTVTVNDQAQGTATATFTVGTTVPSGKPATPGTISGPSTFCKNVTNTYSISAVPYATSYTWTVPTNAIIVSGQGTTQITVQYQSAFTSGQIAVTATNCKGTSAKRTLNVSLYSLPAVPASISGSTSVCLNSTQTYTAAAVSGATGYTWTVPANASIISGQGTTTVTIYFSSAYSSGSIGVYATNCVGNGTAKTIVVRALPIPGSTSTIAGTASICPAVDYVYSVNTVANATSYNWTLPANATLVSGQGTKSITVAYSSSFQSGAINVYASNCSGNGTASTKTITKKAKGCSSGKMDENNDDSDTTSTTGTDMFEVKVYPNPFASYFQLRVESNEEEMLELKIFNVNGQLIEEKKGVLPGTEIELGQGYVNGLYLVQIKQADRVKTVRVIKSE